MDVRRVVSVVILAAFLALAVLSFLGDRLLSGVFIVVAGAVLAHHAVTLCPRCSNRACAFNRRYVRGGRAAAPTEDGDVGAVPFSNLQITRTTVIPLLLTGPLAVVAAWRFSPLWTIGVAVVALTAHFTFRELTCKRCGNDCAGNCNPAYREWKASRRADVSQRR